MKHFTKGELYQVRHYKLGWIIAEYVGFSAAHLAHGVNSDGRTEWREPAKHYWQHIGGSSFANYHRDLQWRVVSPETRADVDRLRAVVRQKEEDLRAAWKELREFCE